MAKKKVVFILKSNPFSWKAFEALRQAVGAAIEHNVLFIFLKDGVYTLTDWKPELIGIEPIDKSIESLGMMGAKIIAESEAVRERGVMFKDWGVDIEVMDKDQICDIIKDAEVVITW